MSRFVPATEAQPFREETIETGADLSMGVARPALLTPEEALRRAKAEAEAIVAAAQAEAANVVEAAKAQADALLEASRESGAEVGFAEGELQGRAQYATSVDALQGLIAGIRADQTRLIDDLGSQVFGLALAMVRRIVGEVVIVQPQVVVRIVREAVAALTSRSQVSVHVHPDDVGHVEETREVLRGLHEDLQDLTIIPDPDISRGSCLVETPNVSVHGTIENAIANLDREIRDAVIVAVDLPGREEAIDVDEVLREIEAHEHSGQVDVDTAASVVKDALAESLGIDKTESPTNDDAPPGDPDHDTEASD